MMIRKGDKVSFRVSRKVNGQVESQDFDSFASASGHASALTGVRIIDIRVSMDDKHAWTATTHIYDKDGTRRIVNAYAVDCYMKHLGVQC